MKNILVFSAILILSFPLYGQNKKNQQQALKLHTLYAGIQGASPGIGYSQMLSNRFSFAFDIGIFSSGIGMNYYLTDPAVHKFSFYTGLSAWKFYTGDPLYYLPFGLSIDGKGRLNFKIDVGLKSSDYVSSTPSESNLGPLFGFRLGYNFGEELVKSKEKEKSTHKNIISLTSSGTDVLVGVVYERLLSPFLGIEAGIGLFGFELGTKLYFPSIRKGRLNFHVGATYSNGTLSKVLHEADGLLYFPVGINLLANNNLRYILDVGPKIFLGSGLYELPAFSFGIGKAF